MPEKLVIGRRTHELKKCRSPELTDVGILVAGITAARPPYAVTRHCLRDGHVIGTIEGEGEIWRDGQWQRCRAGSVFINPPNSAEAFRAIRGSTWTFCWLHTFPEFFAADPAGETRIIEADLRLFQLAIEGYLHSSRSIETRQMSGLWADLVRAYSLRLLHPSGGARERPRRLSRRDGARRPLSDLAGLQAMTGLNCKQLRRYLGAFVHRPVPHAALATLTPRERNTLDLLAAGCLYKEIADQLGISLDTVRSHLKSIYGKLHVHSREEAVQCLQDGARVPQPSQG